jgi:divalent metal cation (Fe/Co/Zn/Cd) transporter
LRTGASPTPQYRAEDLARVTAVLDRTRSADLNFTELLTRESAPHRLISLTVLVPAKWTVQRGHALADEVEAAIATDLPDTDAQTHLEPQPAP